MLSKKQLTTITVNAITVKMLITYPRYLFVLCGNAAWITIIYCTLISVLLFYATGLLYKSDKNVICIADQCGGNVFRIIIGLLVFIVLGMNFLSLIRIFPEMIRLVLLQQTYSEVIGLCFTVALIIGAFCGIEAIGRVHAIFIPFAGFIFAIFIILLIPSFKADNLFPLLGKGASNLFVKGISGLSVFSDLLMLNILIPYMKTKGDYRIIGRKSIWIAGLCALLIIFAYGISYSFPVSVQFFAPVYQLERLIHLSNFFSRFEAIFQFVWSISILLYGSLYLAVLCEVWKESFKLKDSKPLIMPVAALVTGAALIPESFNNMTVWEAVINKWIYIPVFAIPIIIGIVDRVKRNKH